MYSYFSRSSVNVRHMLLETKSLRKSAFDEVSLGKGDSRPYFLKSSVQLAQLGYFFRQTVKLVL